MLLTFMAKEMAPRPGEGGGFAVEEFGNRADAVVEEFFFEANELALDVVHAAHAVDAQIGLEIEAREPRPGGALVVGAVAIFLTSHIIRGCNLGFWARGSGCPWAF